MFQYHISLAVASYIALFRSIHCVPKKVTPKFRSETQKLCGGFCWNLQRLHRKDDKAAKRIFNFDKICRSYSDLNFGVTFLDLNSTVSLHCSNAIWFYCIKFLSLQCEPLEPITVHAEH